MARNYSLGLSSKQFRDMIRTIDMYKQDLETKCQKLASRLVNIGIEVVHLTIAEVPGEERGSYSVEEMRDPPNGAAILLSGNKVLFIEFGAGVIHSQPQHPQASEHGMGVGTYPGQKYAWNLTLWGGGWWYSNGGESIHSYGNPAYMPMYKADVEILERVAEVAKEVFGS